MKNNMHFEHGNHSKHLDESISNIGGVAPRVIAPVRMAVTPTAPIASAPIANGGFRSSSHGSSQQHLAYLRRNLPRIGDSHRQIGISPLGIDFYKSGNGVLFGYQFGFLYPLFYALYNGTLYDESALRMKYDLSDDEWYSLMDKLNNSGYITISQ